MVSLNPKYQSKKSTKSTNTVREKFSVIAKLDIHFNKFILQWGFIYTSGQVYQIGLIYLLFKNIPCLLVIQPGSHMKLFRRMLEHIHLNIEIVASRNLIALTTS